MVAVHTVENYWRDAKCAKAFWSQQDMPPYQALLRDTLDWAAPARGEHWLDLGCGAGALTRAIWEQTRGSVGNIVGLDCADVQERAYARLRETLSPAPGGRIQFICHDFSSGLDLFDDASFDHVVSGLSISYAESYSDDLNRWTTDAYDTILREVNRVLRPGGRFVFSVNVPEPSWFRISLLSLPKVFLFRPRLKTLKRSWRMVRYGAWLKREARVGRFHFLSREAVTEKLVAAGFDEIECRLSYAKQAFIFRCVRSA